MSVVLVTGASSGIGRATALALAERGDTIVLASRSREALEETGAACRALGAQAVAVPTDVGDRDAVDALFADAVERFGRIDGVVSAASVVAYGAFEEVPADVFDHVHRTNVLGAANVARAALVHFHEHGAGSLVLVGSVLGKIATPTMSAYTTSKWAIHALARTLQLEARRTPGVGVSLVSPGGVNTPIYQVAASYTGTGHRPPPPVDAPETVAAAIVSALDRPRREASVGLANAVMVAGFRLLPPVFDLLVGPLMGVFGTTRERVEPWSGNVLEPDPGAEATHGPWWSLPRR
ncbi:MAG: SDR family NAD(P)-dependent oxidoreductase [Marmoricola sp.]